MEITTTTRIPYKYGQTFKIKPLFDVHYGADACDERAFASFLKDSDENTYFIGGGDILDSIHVTDKRYRKSGDTTKGDAVIDEQIKGALSYLMPYRKRILGLAAGNHEDVILKRSGTDPTMRMCSKLEVPYLGFSGLFRITFSEKGGRGRSVVIRYHHGWGGGSRTGGATITKYEKDMRYWDADIYLYGHDHQRKVDETPRLGLSGSRLISRGQWLCVCGNFLKTYVPGSTTYSEIKGYPPVPIGGVVIEIKPESWGVKMRAHLD
jgi:hypothetical protein